MASLSPAQIIGIAIDYCREIHKFIPDSLRADFLVEFQDIHEIATIKDLTGRFCARLKVIFKEPEIEKKYGQLRKEITDEVRWRVEIILADAQEFLKNSFDLLEDGEPWILSKFTATSEGKLFYERFALGYGRKFDLDLIRKILGSGGDTERILEGHSFRNKISTKREKLSKKMVTKKEVNILPIVHDKQFPSELLVYERRKIKIESLLKLFLLTLNKDQEWCIDDLRNWCHNGKPKGQTLVKLIYRWKGIFTLEVVQEIFGEEAEIKLKLNPFIRKNNMGKKI